MRNILFIAWQDIRNWLRDGSTLMWLFLMPPIFFYFIGTVTGGFSSATSGAQATPITVVADAPGFLKEQVDLRLVANDFAPEWVESIAPENEAAAPPRTLTFDANASAQLLADEAVEVSFDTRANSLTREFEEIRIQRALYTVLADIIVAKHRNGPTGTVSLYFRKELAQFLEAEVRRKEVEIY